MSADPLVRRPSRLARDLDAAHRPAVGAAAAGLQDAALGRTRLTGPGVATLADAAVTSATPFLRAPLLSRLSAARRLHEADETGRCPSCRCAAPCPTTAVIAW
ncbi:MAG: hypothetical protein JWN20_1865 [Jatrophihabitantaceae bacterium]|nr:hypothetical protein [Jatrophihabitantaceae bacterium]